MRFRKSIKVAPGIKLNVTKKGVSSVSLGGKGVTVNTGGKRGTKATFNIPGSGISHTENLSSGKSNEKQSEGSMIPVVMVAIVMIIALFVGLSK